jgi:hypothetical protein
MGRVRAIGLVVLGGLAATPGVLAAPLSYAYRTEGFVAPAIDVWRPGEMPSTGVTGTPSISFRGIESGRYDGPGTITLGEFVVAPPGQETTYHDADFGIGFEIPELHRSFSDGRGSFRTQMADLGVYGRLNGRVEADGRANLLVTFDTVEDWFPNRGYPAIVIEDSLPFLPSDFRPGATLQLTTPTGGGTLAVSATVVPEPATVAIFAMAMVGYGLRRRFQSS